MSPSERMTARAVAATWLLDHVTARTAQWNPGSATLTRALASQAPDEPFAHTVVEGLGFKVSSVNSRLMRAGLPTPKEQLAAFRLALSVRLSRFPTNISTVALDLNYSTPQAFSRHIRARLGCTAVELVSRWAPERFLAEVVDPLLLWQDERWIDLDVLHGQPIVPYFKRPVAAVAEVVIRTDLRRDRTCCPSCGRLLVKSA